MQPREQNELVSKRFFCERKKICENRSEFSRKCGLPMESIRGLEGGKTIPAYAINPLRDAGINTDYVLYGNEKGGEPNSKRPRKPMFMGLFRGFRALQWR